MFAKAMNEPLKGRQLVKAGAWCVPPEDRPANWRSMPVAESDEWKPHIPASDLSAVIAATEARQEQEGIHISVSDPNVEETNPEQHAGWLEMKPVIEESGIGFGADKELLACAKLLFAGMFTRRPSCLRKMAGMAGTQYAKRFRTYIDRLYEQKLWNHEDMGVKLGNLDEDKGYGDLSFWLHASVVLGKMDLVGDETFKARKAS